MRSADRTEPVSDAQAAALFSDLAPVPALVIAVSGGPDSVALLVLLARWRGKIDRGPKLTAVTIDHGLRPESKQEAAAVTRLTRLLGVEHRTLRWIGPKPKTGLQEAAREARYRLLSKAARDASAKHVLTAHTLDDQAETILFRLARGSGLTGLMGMMPWSPVPVVGSADILLVRPLLTLPKSRLIATLEAQGISYADDLTNRDPRFARSRLRALMPTLAEEGLTAERLARLGRRVERVELALAAVAHDTLKRLAGRWPPDGRVTLAATPFLELPEVIAEHVMYMAIASIGHEDPIHLGKLEALIAGLHTADRSRRFRRTLAGDMITLNGDILTIERAPARRFPHGRGGKSGRGSTRRLRDAR